MGIRLACLLSLLLLASADPVWAGDYYALTPQRIAPDTYVFEGALEAFDFDNHGAVVNTGFIVTADGVVVSAGWASGWPKNFSRGAGMS